MNPGARQAPGKLVLLSGGSCEGPPAPHPPHIHEGRAEGGSERARWGTLLWAPEEPALPCPTDGGILAPPLLAVTHLSRLGLCQGEGGGCWQGLSPTAPDSSSPLCAMAQVAGPSRAAAQARAQPWRLWGPERREGGSWPSVGSSGVAEAWTAAGTCSSGCWECRACRSAHSALAEPSPSPGREAGSHPGHGQERAWLLAQLALWTSLPLGSSPGPQTRFQCRKGCVHRPRAGLCPLNQSPRQSSISRIPILRC